MTGHSTLMRTLLLCLGLLFSLSATLRAQAPAGTMEFGYANKEGGKVAIGPPQTSFISAGIKLPKMQGNVIKGITLFLGESEGGQGTHHSIFIASQADKKVKYIEDVVLTPGWNTITLKTPFTLTEHTSYYLGYQLQARSGKKPLAFENLTHAKIAGVDFIEFGGVYQEVGDVVELETLEDNALGNMLVFAHVEDKIGKLRSVGTIVSGHFDQAELISGKEHTATLKVRNLGSTPITSLDVIAQFGVEGERTVSLTGLNIPVGKTAEVSAKVTAPRRGLGVFYAAAAKVNASANLFADVKYEMPYKVKMENASWPRKTVLIERFTTERCVNCPGSEPLFESLVAKMKSEGIEVSAIAHHVGYQTDAFTNERSASLLPYSFGSRQFAPALMVNRLEAVAEPRSLASGYGEREQKYTKAKAVNEVLTFTRAKASERNGSLTLSVEGEVGHIDAENLFLTAVVTENHVRAINQAGATGVFYHDHLVRQFLTSEFGAPITLKPDGTFSMEIRSMAIDPKWVKENLEVVIFAHKDIRSRDLTQREVYSSKTISWANLTAINDVSAVPVHKVSVRHGYLSVDTSVDSIAVYDMAGRLITRSHEQRLAPGIYVVRLGYAGKYTMHKVMVD